MSFFGFDTSNPDKRAEKELDYDEILEEKYKYAANDDLDLLEEDDSDLNDETFGDAVVAEDLNFGQSQQRRIPGYSMPPVSQPIMLQHPPNVSAPLSLQEVEMQMRNSNLNNMARYTPNRSLVGPPPSAVLNGIRVNPLELTLDEKNAVFEIFQKIMLLYPHIDTLMKALIEARGDAEKDTITMLHSMKTTISLQTEGFNHGIFIIRSDNAFQLHRSLIAIFNHGEKILAAPAKKVPDVPLPPPKSPSKKGPNESLPAPMSPPQKAPTVQKSSTEVEKAADSETSEIGEVFEESDFPLLGASMPPAPASSSIGIPIILKKKGNQRQRKEELRTDRERENSNPKQQQWTRKRNENEAVAVDSPVIAREDKYKGVMQKHEKELIAKIQISQLVTDNPFVDDYYFQMTKLKKDINDPVLKMRGRKSKKWKVSANQLIAGKDIVNISNELQNQMKRLIESRRTTKKRENSNSVLEGALGSSISKTTNRNPKQAIQFTPQPSIARNSVESSSILAELSFTEKLYDGILRLEDLLRKKVSDKDEDEIEEHEQELELARTDVWKTLTYAEGVTLEVPNPIIGALNRKKGLVAATRALALLETKHCLSFFALLFRRLECLNISSTPLGKETDTVDVFLSTLFPLISGIFSESSLAIITDLVRILLERHNLLWLAKSRVGLEIMTLTLTRAEILKQGTPKSISESEQVSWEEIFDFIFMSFQSQFTELFANNVEPSDEVYIWRFLSALAVGASGIEQQRILVTELRNNIISTSKTDHPQAMENVNLFLKALGLNIDAKKLAEMSQ